MCVWVLLFGYCFVDFLWDDFFFFGSRDFVVLLGFCLFLEEKHYSWEGREWGRI